MGAMIFPNKSPNLIQIKFKGVKTFEFKIPSIKNVNEIITDHTLISLPFNNGQKAISKKKLILDVEAPLPSAPSMVRGIELYVKAANKISN